MDINRIFKQDAKSIGDTLFETKVFRNDLTRDNLNTIEELIDYSMSVRFDSVIRSEKLFKQINKNE